MGAISSRRSASVVPTFSESLSTPRLTPTAYELPPKQTGTITSFFSRPQLSEYVIGAIIGSGGFGKIREIKRRRDGRSFALKAFEYSTMTMRDAETFVNELLALNRIPSHAFIIQLHAAFRDQSAISYVMELLAGGDLRLLLRSGTKITEEMVAYVIGCLGLALHHVHSHGVVHRDVKPENIMFTTDGVPKLIDFGISFILPAESRACVCQEKSGTTQYLAPEVLVPRSHCHGYESDFWSLGVVMFEMVYRKRPFDLHPPSALVRYSKATYQSTWDLLVSRSDEPNGRVTPLSSLDFGSIYRFLHNGTGDTAEEAVSFELMVALPDLLDTRTQPVDATADSRPDSVSTSAPYFIPPSGDCISLLLCLLEVRIEKRYGVGQNFPLFCQHPFFNLDLQEPDSLILCPSPIHPNLEQVALHAWTRFFAENLEESALGLNSPRRSALSGSLSSEVDEIGEYLNRVQGETGAPLFSETRHPSRLRSVREAIRTALYLNL
jgi:serine/threonine protein kinase